MRGRVPSGPDGQAGCDSEGAHNGTTRFVWGGFGGSHEQLSTSNYQLAGWQCLEERDGGNRGAVPWQFGGGQTAVSKGPGGPAAAQERDLNSDDDFADDDEVVWYNANTLYSVYALTDGSENVAERYRYDAYGAVTLLDSDFSVDADNASDAGNPYLYTARRLDAESGLMQYRHRYYASELGRFVSRDPANGWHKQPYLYGRNRITHATDPAGLYPVFACSGDCQSTLEHRTDYGKWSDWAVRPDPEKSGDVKTDWDCRMMPKFEDAHVSGQRIKVGFYKCIWVCSRHVVWWKVGEEVRKRTNLEITEMVKRCHGRKVSSEVVSVETVPEEDTRPWSDSGYLHQEETIDKGYAATDTLAGGLAGEEPISFGMIIRICSTNPKYALKPGGLPE